MHPLHVFNHEKYPTDFYVQVIATSQVMFPHAISNKQSISKQCKGKIKVI